MKNKWFIPVLAVAMPLALAAVLSVHLTRANSKAKSSPIEVKVDNFTFKPDTPTISVNSTVTWVNKDDVPHTIASTDGLFKSQALDTDEKYSHTFTNAGTYSYYCSIHPKMVAQVVVQ